MAGPGEKRKNPIVDVILVLLVVVLIYVLYRLVGGHWTPGDMSGGVDIFGSIAAFGQELRKMFGNMLP